MDRLSPRKEEILRAVVFEYVSTVEPISSDLLSNKYDFGVKGATIRNELAEITELGLLEQPHTSSGRIPSDLGYRYFVDQLMILSAPKGESATRLSDAAKEDVLKVLLQGTTKTLSRLTHLLAVAATTRDPKVKIRNSILTALGPRHGLLVIVFDNGHVENRSVEFPSGLTLLHIGRINDILRLSVDSITVAQLKRLKAPDSDDFSLKTALASVFASLRETARDMTRGHLVVEGQEYVVSQPEFLEDRAILGNLLASIEDEDRLHAAVLGDGATIGGENESQAMHDLSILRRPFRVRQDEIGSVALLGPTRLPYDRAFSLLDYAAKSISHTLTKVLD
ncbi:MAG: heat-inducible transcription repressor HrcA [Chthonomonadaceae bacterium]|nr:heat-inducible transcription repressor HrcA [Chthonomonadaceae bacterium]